MENKLLATVDGREITQEVVNYFIQGLDPQTAAQLQSEAGQNQVLEELVNQELFYLEAKKLEMDKNEIFLKEIERIKENLLKQFALNQLLSKIQVSSEEIAAYYEENKSQYNSPRSVKASHILVKELDQAESILLELKEGVSFEEAAQKYSTCPSKEKGGDLGFFNKGQMVPEFEEAAFTLEQNTISEPIQTQFGYHIIKVTDEKQEGSQTLVEVKEQIQKQLLG